MVQVYLKEVKLISEDAAVPYLLVQLVLLAYTLFASAVSAIPYLLVQLLVCLVCT